mmetsp:Transcript_35135/g.92252  ORF Transcript_35135/g.92252 Transcript_35135/m.92252 type:complete len:214 (-) Transcript_35135:510-1151(-)
MRGPRDSLDGGRVLVEAQERRRRVRRPDIELVVVAARGKLLAVEGPLQPTDLLLVPRQLRRKVLRHTHIPLEDEAVPAAGGECVPRPAERADAGLVAAHGARGLALGGIPDLHLADARTYRQVCAALRPTHRRHRVLRAEVTELCHLRRACRPEVYARAQPDGEHVERGPVDQVQVKVVLQRRRIQHLVWHRRDLPRRLARAAEHALRVGSDG